MCRLLRSLLAFALAVPALAQSTKIDLATQVKGQLPNANAQGVIAAASAAATAAGLSSATGGSITGSNANGVPEIFYGDIHGGSPGNLCQAPGWDAVSGLACYTGMFVPMNIGTTGSATRTLEYSGGSHAANTSGGFLARLTYAGSGGNAERIGWNANTVLSPLASANLNLGLLANANGFYTDITGSQTLLWALGGNASGTPGITDSGSGYGWGAIAPGVFDVGLWFVDSTDLIASFAHAETVGNSATFRVHSTNLPTCVNPCGYVNATTGVQNFFAQATVAQDRIGPVEMATDFVGTPRLLIPHVAGRDNMAAVLMFATHADGTECLYDGSEATGACQDIFVFVPASYDPHGNNRWVLEFHGANNSPIYNTEVVLNQPNDGGDLMDALHTTGYVIVAMENTNSANGRNCYGTPQCVADVAHTMALVHKYLSLAPQPYLVGDSQGCFTMLNAVAQGVVTPPAMAGYSCNTNLNWAANNANAGGGPQMQYIEESFGFSIPAQYAAATGGYDPLLNASTAGILQNRLAAVPTLMVADPTDGVAPPSVNALAYVNAINQVRAGSASVVSVPETNPYAPASDKVNGPTATYYPTGGGHVGSVALSGSQLVNFFNLH